MDFTWTPERVKEFTAIYAGNFANKNVRFGYSDFIGLKYEQKVAKYQRLVSKMEGSDSTNEEGGDAPVSRLSLRERPTFEIPHPFSTIRRWIVSDIMTRIVLPNMGWRAQCDDALQAKREISEAVDTLVNDIDFHFQPDD
jgi:hypothetical protein